MVKRNPHLASLQENYLFVEIKKRIQQFLAENKHASLINLGIGDTTQPISKPIVEAFSQAAQQLGNEKSYRGYGSSQGELFLRQAIAEKIYHNNISADEIFISDGSKCDIGRLQQLFSNRCSLAVQDPTYPAYVGSSLISGKEMINYLPCTPENNFYPKPDGANNLIYLCSPNNPTGHVMNRKELQSYVIHAQKVGSIIIFDSAYSSFIQDPQLPKSIFEISGAKKVAIETGSFSKLFGFTGVRLGWLVIPKEVQFDDGHPVIDDWTRVNNTLFNGASNIAQAGGIAALTDEGLEEGKKLVSYYLKNGEILAEALDRIGVQWYGGKHAPYLWVKFGEENSWALFDRLLTQEEIITTPGVGFGPSGEGFIRLSAFAKRADIEEAARRLERVYSLNS